jgi:uracil phosphoribosyltransferase
MLSEEQNCTNERILNMVINLSEQHSLLSNWVAELRDTTVQTDRMRFRRNLERIGEVAAYEISKTLNWKEEEVTTPLVFR